MKRRVVVTGIGALTPIGNNVETFWNNVKAGVLGIDEITKFDTTDYSAKLAAEVKDFNAKDHEYLDKKDVRKMDKFIQYGLIAAKEAIKDSKLEIDSINHDRFGVVVSSGIGLAFIVFPKVFTVMGTWGTILGCLFFACLVFAGLTSCVSLVEAVNSFN